VGLDADAVVGDEVRNRLQRGFVFRAGLVVQVPKVSNQEVIAL
jgi:hypothetical protein